MTRLISVIELIEIAQDLVSEDGENSEYDRALIEICVRAARLSHEEDTPTLRKIILEGQNGHNNKVS